MRRPKFQISLRVFIVFMTFAALTCAVDRGQKLSHYRGQN